MSLKLNSESSKPQTLKKLFNAFVVKRLPRHYFPLTSLCFLRLKRKFRHHLKYHNLKHNHNYHHTSTFIIKILTPIPSGRQLERIVEHHQHYRHYHHCNYHHITSTLILTSIPCGGQLERVVEHLAIDVLLVPVNCCHSSYL